MYFLKDLAEKTGLKPSTLRYWLDKNQNEVENGTYEINISDLFEKIPIYKQNSAGKKRRYYTIIIFDIDEAVKQVKQYIYTVERQREINKQRNKVGFRWTYSAAECYENNLDCDKCEQNFICEKNVLPKGEEYPMKKLVRKLLAELGTPCLADIERFNRDKIPLSLIQIIGCGK